MQQDQFPVFRIVSTMLNKKKFNKTERKALRIIEETLAQSIRSSSYTYSQLILEALEQHSISVINSDMYDEMADLVGAAWDELSDEYLKEDEE